MPQLQTQFVTCPKCAGMAKNEKGLICPECGGVGLGTFIKNDFLYWGYDLTPAKIIVRQSRIIFNWAVDLILLLAGAGGMLSFLWWMKDNAISENYKIYAGTFFSFWGDKDGLILFFWIGVLCLLFFYFRYKRRIQNAPNVKFRKYRSYQRMLKQSQRVPNNWRELRLFRTKFDVSKSYSKGLVMLLERAYALALQYKHEEFMPIHIILTAIGEKEAKKQSVESSRTKMLFTKLNIHKGKIGPKMEEQLRRISAVEGREAFPAISRELRQCLVEAYLQAMDNRHKKVGILDLVSSLAINGSYSSRVFSDMGVNLEDIENAAEWQIINDHYAEKKYILAANRKHVLNSKFNRATLAVATPVLNHFCRDLTFEVKTSFNKIFVGQEEKVDEIFKAFADKNKNIILSGAPGTGKKTIIKNIAERILEDDVPRILSQKRILVLDLKKLRDEAADVNLDDKLSVMALELIKATNTILSVENLTDDLWRIFSQYAGSLYLLATAEREIQFEGVKNIKIEEPVKDDLLRILLSNAVELEDKCKVSFDYPSILTVAAAGRNYYSNEREPARSAGLLKRIAKSAGAGMQKGIDSAVVAKFVAREKNVPYTQVLKDS